MTGPSCLGALSHTPQHLSEGVSAPHKWGAEQARYSQGSHSWPVMKPTEGQCIWDGTQGQDESPGPVISDFISGGRRSLIVNKEQLYRHLKVTEEAWDHFQRQRNITFIQGHLIYN
ncbi:unnamed protein product [Pleuronectes platessa]|uniref:Uncharacterized protein n=1 Tax=Pleuronectes platessa TaxID=8262 RepID=A0A9N7ULJ9_PLEPL|nr:unnamed protein product [Pleuronectes platessa]